MFAARQRKLLQWNRLPQLQSLIPVGAGCIMLLASVLPWLNDPLGDVYSPWKLPIDIGWQFHLGILNYGLLCLGCACCSFAVAYAQWKPFRGSTYVVQRCGCVGWLCLVPVILFLLQYLCADVVSINHLAQHKIQMLLIQRHFGYSVPKLLISINPLILGTSSLQDRLELLADQVSIGLILPFLGAWMLIDYKPLLRSVTLEKQHNLVWLASIFLLVLALAAIVGRAPLAMISEYQAKASLEEGNYQKALEWLDKALILNPALNQVAFYHIERGQALYFLHPYQQSDETHAYLAFTYHEQRANLKAYQELRAVWQSHPSPWIVDEMDTVLESLTEYSRPLSNLSTEQLNDASESGSITEKIAQKNNARALSWLQALTYVDSNNVYGQYMIGRLAYEQHNYTQCMAQMVLVIQLSSDADLQSSGYTYMALSDAGQGDYVGERKLLLKALELDPAFRNNTAREELSGLR